MHVQWCSSFPRYPLMNPTKRLRTSHSVKQGCYHLLLCCTDRYKCIIYNHMTRISLSKDEVSIMFNKRWNWYGVYNQHVYTTWWFHLYRADWIRHNTFKSGSITCQSMLVVGNAKRRRTIQKGHLQCPGISILLFVYMSCVAVVI